MWIARLDRRAGAAVRRGVARRRGGVRAARALAAGLSPAFRLLVAGLIASRAGRGAGADALVAGVVAALAARGLRDALGRPRPGARRDAGFPSRHAAAAAAIAGVVSRHHPRLGRALAGAAALGLAARVAAGEHEPGDILAGASLGAVIALSLRGSVARSLAFRRCRPPRP